MKQEIETENREIKSWKEPERERQKEETLITEKHGVNGWSIEPNPGRRKDAMLFILVLLLSEIPLQPMETLDPGSETLLRSSL